MNDESTEGRIFFSSRGRTLSEEDQICILSVGVDVGSSTSHLAFSRIILERLDNRYVVTERETFFESEILLTPYGEDYLIDADALDDFIQRQYRDAQIQPHEIDTGALILTGVAVERHNARRIGDLFAQQAGKMVAVSAGDSLETTMAAFGSGAASQSLHQPFTLMNVDIGGGTSKIAVCLSGKVVDLTAVNVGARLVCFDSDRRITRIEEAGRCYGRELNLDVNIGVILSEPAAQAIVELMAKGLVEAMLGGVPVVNGSNILRLPPLSGRRKIDRVMFSGGVAEYIYGRQPETFGDLGKLLASAVNSRVRHLYSEIVEPQERIRATVIGASQYTSQVSGGTIFISPLDVLPLRNVPVVAPILSLIDDDIEPAVVSEAIQSALVKLDLIDGKTPVAIFAKWAGSATFQRLDSFCRGLVTGLATVLNQGHPIVLIGDGDVGGLLGIHLHQELKLSNPVVSIDGLELNDFDYVDIGTVLETSGAVPVVIKSLIFPVG